MLTARLRARPWLLVLGPGANLASIRPLFAALTSARGSAELVTIRDLAELLEIRTKCARVLLDADCLPLEDLGIVRRFLDRAPDVDLVLVTSDPSLRPARQLLDRARVCWRSWPLDTDQLHQLVRELPARA